MHEEKTRCDEIPFAHLFISENEQRRVTQLSLLQQPRQLVLRLVQLRDVTAVDDVDDCLRVEEVVLPEWAKFRLASDIPHCEADVFVLHSLNIEP